MTEEDEEFLTELYRNLTKQAVSPTSPLYVPLEELPGQVMGPDAVKLLCRTITMTTPGEAFFLTGLRGSGKTGRHCATPSGVTIDVAYPSSR